MNDAQLPEDVERLRVARTMSGLEQRQLATQLGISHSYLARMEEGNRKITKNVKNWTEKIIKKWFAQELTRCAAQAREDLIIKTNMIQLGIDVFFESEKQRGEEEKKGLRRRDGGPTMMAFSLLRKIKEELAALSAEGKDD